MAEVLNDAKVKSRRKGEHDQVVCIAGEGAVKHWINDRSGSLDMTAQAIRHKIEGDIAHNGLSTDAEVIQILKEHAAGLRL